MNHRSEFDGPWFISFHKFSMVVDRWRVFQVRHSTYTFNGNATGWFACLRTPDTEKFFHRWITNHATWLADSAPIVPWRHQLRHRYTQTIAHFFSEKKIQGKAMLGGSDKTRKNQGKPNSAESRWRRCQRVPRLRILLEAISRVFRGNISGFPVLLTHHTSFAQFLNGLNRYVSETIRKINIHAGKYVWVCRPQFPIHIRTFFKNIFL